MEMKGYSEPMFRRYGSTSFRSEKVPKHRVNTENSKRQKRRRYKALYRAKRFRSTIFKRSETDVNSDLSVKKTVSKWLVNVTSEHGQLPKALKNLIPTNNARNELVSPALKPLTIHLQTDMKNLITIFEIGWTWWIFSHPYLLSNGFLHHVTAMGLHEHVYNDPKFT